MFTHYGRWSLMCAMLARLFLIPAGAAPVTVGVALPQGQALQGAEAAEPMRQNLISQLKAQSFDAVPLGATSDNLVDAEAQSKHCNYVLYTRLERHGSSGFRSKLSALSGVLPMAAFSGRGASSITGTLMQGAANAAASSAQQQAMSQFTGAAAAGVKQGDIMTMSYRLMSVGSANPLKSESFDSAKAGGDGQDIISPLVAQVAGAVGTVAQGSPAAAAPATTSGAAPAAPTPAGDPASSSGHASAFGALFGHHSASNTKPAPGSTNGTMDCAQIASMPNAPVSAATCEQMRASQQIYNQAAADPSASRPGDDQMTCAQITAELKQQTYTAPDKTKVAEAAATANQQQDILHKEYNNMLKQQAEDQAAVNAANAADTATELATGGLVRGRALNAVEKTLDEKHKANNERVIKEDMPVTSKLTTQTSGLGADAAQQLQANPRLARLMQLADSKHCKGGS
jgi:hypothetical protein